MALFLFSCGDDKEKVKPSEVKKETPVVVEAELDKELAQKRLGIKATTPTTQNGYSIKAEEEAWNKVKQSNTIQDYQDFLTAFPTGQYSGIVAMKLRKLQSKPK